MDYKLIVIPEFNDSFVRIVIGKSVYLLRFSYVDTGDFWTFGVFNTAYEAIVQNIKIVPGIPLNLQYVDEDMPPVMFGCKSALDRVGRYDFKNGLAEFVYFLKSDLGLE